MKMLAWRPAHVSTSKNMAMQMRHSFPGIRTIIENQAESRLGDAKVPGYLRGLKQQMAEHLMIFGSRLSDPGDRLLWNHQNMSRRLRFDIPESQHQVILINNRRRNFSRNDFLKQG